MHDISPKTQIACLRADIEEICRERDKAEAEAQALREEVAALRLDAGRYRWLRDKCNLFEHYRTMKWRPDAFEREIDAAMQGALLGEGKES